MRGKAEDTDSIVGLPVSLTVLLALLMFSGVPIPVWAVLLPLTIFVAWLTLMWLITFVLMIRGESRTDDSVDTP